MSTLFNPFKCLKPDDKSQRSSLSRIHMIGLVNGLSGGHKGEKVQHILNNQQIPTFDLFKLSTDDEYFQSFLTQFCQMYDAVIMEELNHIKDNINNFQLHPRILIGGGDGSIAWALSILDRVLLEDKLLKTFWRRSRIISELPNAPQQPFKLSVKRHLSEQTTVSTEFYYAKQNESATQSPDIVSDQLSPPNQPQITPLDISATSFNFNALHKRNTVNNRPQIDTDIIVKESTDNTCRIPEIHIDLRINNELKIDDDCSSRCSSSASTSAENETQILEEFMNETLSQSPINGDDDIIRDNDSVCSLVTREELESVVRQKESAALFNNAQSSVDLRILQTIYDCGIAPCISLVPLGTGNDLSRCLGTGFTYPGSKELTQRLIPEYLNADITKLDRWRIVFLCPDYVLKPRQTSELLCYFSIGFEGQIAYKFACARTKNPKLFDRPWKNKMQYLLSGIGAGVEEALRITKPLNDVIECYVDGERLKLPSNTRSLVVSNIQSMADGVYFWGKGPDTKKDIKQYSTPKLGDGKLEVMAAKGIYKYLQMKIGASHYRRLAQPKKVTIIMKSELPIQVDGESWIESKGIIQIYLLHQVFAVVGKNEPRGVQII